MTDLISFVTNTGSAAPSTAASTTGLADNFDTFLTLLTAQMQNQDPLEPLDSTQFTEQLVQFSSVEQQIKTNESIESLVKASSASTGAALSGYLGQTAEIDSTGQGFHGDDVSWSYQLGSDAENANIIIQNQNGEIVHTSLLETSRGRHEFTWDGVSNAGETVPTDEVYYATITASDANGDAVTTGVSVLAKVTGVDMSYDNPAITTSAGIFSYTDVLRIS